MPLYLRPVLSSAAFCHSLYIFLKQQLHLITHFNSRSDKLIRFFSSFVFGFQILSTASQTCSDQIQHIYIVKTIINGLSTQTSKADKLCVALFCHIHQQDQQMGGIGLYERVVHDQNLSLIFICKNVRIIPSHIIHRYVLNIHGTISSHARRTVSDMLHLFLLLLRGTSHPGKRPAWHGSCR